MLKKLAGALQEVLLNFIFPPHCPICDAYVENRGDWCEKCFNKIFQPEQLALSVPMQAVINRAWALTLYRGGTRNLIRGLKYQGKRIYLPYLQKILLAAEKNPDILALLQENDIAVLVPLHEQRQKKRGFNQTALIFQKWLEKNNVPVVAGLSRIRATRPMYALSLKDRQANLRKAFNLNSDFSPAGKHVLLLDDIMTTGATLYACAKLLHQAGASSVDVLVMASDHWQ